MEIALRYFLACLDNYRYWPTILLRLSAALSNSTSRGIGLTLIQVLFNQYIREGLDLARVQGNNKAPVDITIPQSSIKLAAVKPAIV